MITPPPINVHEAVVEDYDILQFEGETIAEREMRFENECREGLGFKTWCAKLRYAEAIVKLAGEYENREDGRVGVADFWRALTNYGLAQEGRQFMMKGAVDTEGNGKWPGCGLPGAKEFEGGVFTDRLHLGERGYSVLSSEVVKVLDEKWPELA